MSDTPEDIIQSDRNNEKDENICRDYVRGLCERKFCKFKHDSEPRLLNFCHDFQNNVCPRTYCKFIHCSVDEADEYKRSGQLSCQILAEASKKNQMPGALNVCNQFRRGQCRRANCKYRHISKEQEDAEVGGLMQNVPQKAPVPPVVVNTGLEEGQLIALGALSNVIRRNGVNFEEYKDDGLPLLKRRFVTTAEQEIVPCEILEQPGQPRPVFKGYFTGNPPSQIWNRIDARSIMLEEENSILHKEIAQLKKQVSDLTATNEFLLDQNATLRLTGQRGVAAGVGQPAPPPQQVGRTVIAGVAAVPVSLATVSTCAAVSGGHSVSIAGCPTVSIASAAPQLLANSQQILVTTNPTTQLAIAQQNLANNLAAQQQPQLTLTAAPQQLTSQAQHMANQQMALASAPQQLTSQAQHMAGQPQQLAQAQQLAQSMVSGQQLLAQQGLAIQTSQAIAMSNASQPMVSFPMMTQSMSHALTH